MKKNIIIATIAVASAFILSVSCQKQEISVSENTNDSEIVAFTATIDQESTKTVLAEGSATNKSKVHWETTDKISIKGAEYTVSSFKDDATKAIFSGNGATKEENKYKAIYPSTLYKTDHFELPSIQTYAAGKFNAPMYAESETESLAFKNICGVLCLSLKGDSNDKVKYITVIANEGVCGKFTMSDATTLNLSSNTNPVEYSRAVSLDCSHFGESAKNKADGGVALSSTATDFYIYLPPKTYTAGMKIIITTTDSKVFEKITAASATIERNNIYTFNDWTLNFQPKPTLLSGVFTVGEGKTVQFTKGNLWADGSNALHFETNQWEYVPTQMDAQMDNNHVSHFNWSSTVAQAVGTTNDGGNLFCDENNKQTVDTQEGCYALNKDEWNHLFKERTNYDSKYGCAMLNKKSVRGIIILPDTFNDPYVGFRAFDASTESDPRLTPSYSEAEWIAMESEGAVFLPAAGYRSSSTVGNIYNDCFYWSSSEGKEDWESYSVNYDFNANDPVSGLIGARSRTLGSCLRLVKDVASGPGPEYVEMTMTVGGVEKTYKWAKCNLGADSETGYGDYYVWGTTVKAYSAVDYTKTTDAFTFVSSNPYGDIYKNSWDTSKGFDWVNTPFTNGVYSLYTKNVFTKYVPQSKASDYGDGSTFYDDKTVLDLDDDVAHKVLGGTWRLPTKAEFDALCSLTKEWKNNYKNSGVNGYLFTDKNGNSLFFPAAKYGLGLKLDGTSGTYWSSSLDTDSPDWAFALLVNNSNAKTSSSYYYRYYGRSVRAISE